MFTDTSKDVPRINARQDDAFDIYNIRHYAGPNPYLETAALVFDFAFTGYLPTLPLKDYVNSISQHYPHLDEQIYESYAQLFAQTVSEVGKLDMGILLDRWSLKSCEDFARISVHTLHARTQRAVVYMVWDWFEAITKNETFEFEQRMRNLQETFRASVYGGPTVNALLQAANKKEIPTFYLWDERLMQYGYGKKQVRGAATTFDCDSHLDSDFTTRKDECKAFLETLGFPVPKGDVIRILEEALVVADRIGYPVAVKPVVGHKGIGVTANVQDSEELAFAFNKAVEAIAPDQPIEVIVERSIKGVDFRLLCINGRFVAATERRPASVTGDGLSNIAELIKRENHTAARLDTPTSPLGKIKTDESMRIYLQEQGLSLDSIITEGQVIYLRKVANLSAGGLSVDATQTVHPDNIVLAQDIAQHFRLTCLGIDVIAPNLSSSWKSGDFGIIEINAAPGVYMHLRPAIGESVDVPSHILETFFRSGAEARIPIITFNRISVSELQQTIDHILLQRPDWSIGAVCQEAVFVNRALKSLNQDYNTNVQNLLRNPKLDLLIVEYNSEILEREGMFYYGSNLVVLDNPTETEMMLKRDVFDDSTIVIKEKELISIRRRGLVEQYQLGEDEPFSRVYLKEIPTILPAPDYLTVSPSRLQLHSL